MSTSVSPRNSGKRSSVLRRWVIGISALLLTFILFIIIRIQGHVSGREFAPTHFQQRDFSFYEIPLIHLQITPIKRTGSTPKAARYLRSNSLIPTFTGVPTTWHLVSISRGVTGNTPRDAALLLDQLDLGSSGDPYWRKWSVDHAAHAKVLWPVVQQLARRELYVLLPELFELAQIDQTPAELAQRIDQLLLLQYQGLIRDMDAADRKDLAKELLSEALVDYPNDPELQRLARQLKPDPKPATEPSAPAAQPQSDAPSPQGKAAAAVK